MSTTSTKERPILFSAPMVRALLTKTQTRRTRGLEDINAEPDAFARAYTHGVARPKKPNGTP